MQNRHAGLQIGSLNIGNQPHRETGNEAFLQAGDLAGGTVTGYDQLAPCFMQGIKGVEEFFLGIFFSFNELDIID